MAEQTVAILQTVLFKQLHIYVRFYIGGIGNIVDVMFFSSIFVAVSYDIPCLAGGGGGGGGGSMIGMWITIHVIAYNMPNYIYSL